MKLTPYQIKIQEAILKKTNSYEYKVYHDFINKGNKSVVADKRYEIALHKTPTLSRVLYCLDDDYTYHNGMIFSTDGGSRMREYICDRQLLKDNGEEATLWDQSEEVQKIIGDILLGK